MTPQEVKQKAIEEFKYYFLNHNGVHSKEYMIDFYLGKLSKKIDEVLDLAIVERDRKIVEILEKTKLPVNSVSENGMSTLMYIPNEGFNREINNRVDWIISLITNSNKQYGKRKTMF